MVANTSLLQEQGSSGENREAMSLIARMVKDLESGL